MGVCLCVKGQRMGFTDQNGVRSVGYKLQYTSSIKQCMAIPSPHKSSDVYLPPVFICWWTTLPMAAHRPRFRARSVILNTGALASIAYTHTHVDRQTDRGLVG